jgi:glycine/D-amino acid oxidase-like deaminating enzyme
MTRLIRYSTELYARLEAETGLSTGWKQCGSLAVARSADRMVQLKRTAAVARAYGVDCDVITPREAGERTRSWRPPICRARCGCPATARPIPADLTIALAKGARNRGVKIFENVRVLPATAVQTDAAARARARLAAQGGAQGTIAADIVVLCGGQWSRDFARRMGVAVPLFSCEHYYIVTDRMAGVHRDLPVMRDPDGYIYFKEEVGGLLMGGFEPEATPWLQSARTAAAFRRTSSFSCCPTTGTRSRS